MESIDRLRDWLQGRLLLGNGWNELNEIADEIEREGMEERSAAYNEGYDAGFASADDWAAQHEDAMAEHGWVRLPLDAEGVPIHVGETVTCVLPFGGESKPFVVDRMELGRDGDGNVWSVALDRSTDCWEQPLLLRHHDPTVEDVLREFADIVRKERVELATISEDTIAEFAAKLRLAGEDA